MAFLKRLLCKHKYYMTCKPYLMMCGATKWADLKCSKCGKTTTMDIFEVPINRWDMTKKECFCLSCGQELRYSTDINQIIYEDDKSIKCRCNDCDKEYTWDKLNNKLIIREEEQLY